MLSIELRPELAQEIQTEAERRDTSVDELVNQWLAEQLWRAKQKKIQEEAERFRAQHAQLLFKYRGRYIAMREGRVVDNDADLSKLHTRIRARYGNEAILMTPVNDEPIQTINVLGARRPKKQP